MTVNEQKAAAKAFVEAWKDKGYEKGESQPFWLALLRNVFGVEKPEEFIIFEEQVKLDHTSFIDVLIPETHVMIEQKGSNKDLRKPIKQSDGTLLTPFQQAKRYSSELPYSQRPRWIVTCNFQTFLVYDMENPSGEPEEILLENLEKEYYRFSFLVDTGNTHLKREMEISIQAGDIVGVLYDAILKQYIDPSNEHSLKSLNMLCVRLVFCLYAEDAGIFGRKNMFHDYLAGFQTKDMRRALIDLFKILDTKPEDRDPYDNSMLSEFPYVNGGLFADENIEIPQFTDEIRDVILSKASDDFDWSEISPTIFGAVFESTLMSCVELLFPPTATLPQIKFSFSYILSILACCFLRHVFICPLDHFHSFLYSLFVTNRKRERTAPPTVRSFSHTQVLQKQVPCRVMP